MFYTDVHSRVEWKTPDALEMAAAAINDQASDLILCGGDVITDGFESSAEMVAPRWDAYLAMQGAINGTIHTAIGNHDLVAAMPKDGSPASADPRAIFREKLGIERTYRSFDAGGHHVIILDPIEVTGDELKYRGFIGQEQMDWLKTDLGKVDASAPVILLTHMPLLTAFYEAVLGATEPAPRNRVVVNNREVLALFEKHNLLLVLQGHLHVNEMIRWRDTTFITGGAVAGKWWRGNWHGTEEGFGVVTIENGRVDWQYIDYGWEARRPVGS
ncbi:MAG: metallophosphoesterase [bacterium]